jgi:hypothetical protein
MWWTEGTIRKRTNLEFKKCMRFYVVDQRVKSEKEHAWSESKCMCVYGGSEGNI